MRHGVKKTKFSSGKDANKMLLRKLVSNFLGNGFLKTTNVKAKVLKSELESLVTKMKVRKESNKNVLISYLNDKKLVEECFKTIGPALTSINGGYVRVIKLGQRDSDGTNMARVEWAYPVVKEDIKKESKDDKKQSVAVKKAEEK